jgi:hypothetical protein
MKNITIIINAAATEEADFKVLEQRVADAVRRIVNPSRCDEGLTSLAKVIVTDGVVTIDLR